MKNCRLESPSEGEGAPSPTRPHRSLMARCLCEPLLHFALLGGLIFAVGAWRDREGAKENAATHIEVTAGTIAWLREGFTRQWHRPPDEHDLRGLVTDHVREEVLYREALSMGLDRDDSIVRRRMAQKMEFLTQDIAAAVEPEDAALRKFFADNAGRYAKSPRMSFRHVFFSKERRGTKLEADAGEALALLTKGASDEIMGDPFLAEHSFTDANEEEIAAVLGREFAEKVTAMPAGEWRGPVASSYGLHLVRVSGRTEPQAVAFEAVRHAVARDFSDERRRTVNRDVLEGLKARYRITVDGAALTNAAALPSKTATR